MKSKPITKAEQAGMYSKEAKKNRKRKKVVNKTCCGKKEVSTLKQADSNYSKSIRLTYVVAVEDPEHAYARCYTCGNLVNIKDLHNGHYIKRGNKSVRFNRKFNSRPQCPGCNDHGKGEQEKYRTNLVNEFGSEAVAEFELMANRNRFKVKSIHPYALYLINKESLEIINRICKEKNISKW
jgi:hypothetical protein